MKLIVPVLGAVLLLAVAAFCLFGFLATFEPTGRTTQFMIFRILYAAVGSVSVLGAVFLPLKQLRK